MEKICLELAVTEGFLDAAMKKFHFDEKDRDSFWKVGQQVEAAAKKEAGFWYRESRGLLQTVLTLGAGVDALQEQYTKDGLLTECYMAETIAAELMMAAYHSFNRWVEAHTGRHVARYYFYGNREAAEQAEKKNRAVPGQEKAGQSDPGSFSLRAMQEVVRAFGIPQVQCNQACCLTPKKSVVFAAELTADAGVRCEGICAGCGRRDCPNRYGTEEEGWKLRWPDFADRALPYGYARILGSARKEA